MVRRDLLIISLLLVIAAPRFVFARTEAPLVPAMIDAYNASVQGRIGDLERGWIMSGSAHEGIRARTIHHAVDPSTQRDVPEGVTPLSSAVWAHDGGAQSPRVYEGVSTWEEGVAAYQQGDRERAFTVLGHLLHLVDDAGGALNGSMIVVALDALTAPMPTGLDDPRITVRDEQVDGATERFAWMPNASGELVRVGAVLTTPSGVRVLSVVHPRIAAEATERRTRATVAAGADVIAHFLAEGESMPAPEHEARNDAGGVPRVVQSFIGRVAHAIGGWARAAGRGIAGVFQRTAPPTRAPQLAQETPVEAAVPPTVLEPVVPVIPPTVARAPITRPRAAAVSALPLVVSVQPIPSALVVSVVPITPDAPSTLPPSDVPVISPEPEPQPVADVPPVISMIPEEQPIVVVSPPAPLVDILGFPIGFIPSTRDRVPPEVSVDAAPAVETIATNATVAFHANEEVLFSCTFDSGAAVTPCSSPVTLTGLALGVHALSISATDNANNTTLAPTTVSWTVVLPPDTTPPATPVLDDVAPIITATTITFSGTREADAIILVDGTADGVTFASATTWSATRPRGLFPQTFTIIARDAAGNESVPAILIVESLETALAPVTDFAAPSATTSSVTLTWKAPIDDPATLRASLSYALRFVNGIPAVIDEAVWDAATPVAGLPTVGVADATETFTAGNLAPLVHTFMLRVTDGTRSSVPAAVTIDLTPPAAPVITIAEVHFQGGAGEEFIRLSNTGNALMDLAGWTIRDEAGDTHVYTFGAITLAANASITLFTRVGDDTATEVYWDRGSAIWNDGGDTVFLRNPSGTLIESFAW